MRIEAVGAGDRQAVGPGDRRCAIHDLDEPGADARGTPSGPFDLGGLEGLLPGEHGAVEHGLDVVVGLHGRLADEAPGAVLSLAPAAAFGSGMRM